MVDGYTTFDWSGRISYHHGWLGLQRDNLSLSPAEQLPLHSPFIKGSPAMLLHLPAGVDSRLKLTPLIL
jgi:hypothetical protein